MAKDTENGMLINGEILWSEYECGTRWRPDWPHNGVDRHYSLNHQLLTTTLYFPGHLMKGCRSRELEICVFESSRFEVGGVKLWIFLCGPVCVRRERDGWRSETGSYLCVTYQSVDIRTGTWPFQEIKQLIFLNQKNKLENIAVPLHPSKPN